MEKKLIYINTDSLICPYCKETPYLIGIEYFCPTCQISFSLVTLKEIEEKKIRRENHSFLEEVKNA